MTQEIALTKATLVYGELDLNDHVTYFLLARGFRYPPPPVKQQYADSALRHGRMPTEAWKYNDRDLFFEVLVHGENKAEYESALSALMSAVYARESVVKWCPAGRTAPIYFHARRAADIDPADYFDTKMRDANEAVVRWSCTAHPFGRTDRRFLPFTRGVGLNDSFEKYYNDGTRDIFEDWNWEVVGSGQVTANTDNYLTGAASVKLKGLFAGDVVELMDRDYLEVNADHHHNAKLYAYKHSGTGKLRYVLYCYDAEKRSCGERFLLNNYDPPATTWVDALKVTGSPVLYPERLGRDPLLPSGTVYVKRKILLVGIGEVSIDSLYLGDTEYVVGHELDGTFAIMCPKGVCAGDVPAPARLCVGSTHSAGPFSPISSGTGVAINAINGFNSSAIWGVGGSGVILRHDDLTWAAQASGTSAYLYSVYALDAAHVWAGGAGRVMRFFDGTSWSGQSLPAFPEKLSNPGMESGNPPTNWTLVTGTSYNRGAPGHSGSYSCVVDPAPVSEWECDGRIGSEYVPVVPGNQYACSAWVRHEESFVTLTAAIKIRWYASASESSYLSTTTVKTWSVPKSTWTQGSGPATAPASANYARVQLHTHGYWAVARWDDVSFKLASLSHINGIHGTASDNVYAVGDWGEIYKFTAAWAWMTSGHTDTLYAVYALDGTHVWAVGANGNISFCDGATWSHAHYGDKDLRGVYAADATHVWAVGRGGTIYFYNGSYWTDQNSRVTEDLYAVWGCDATHVWAVGASGRILRWDGTSWGAIGGGGSKVLRGVYVPTGDRVWASGYEGTILKGISTVGAMPMTNLVIAQRKEYAKDWSPVQDADGDTQVSLWSRRGHSYRSIAAGGSHKFRFPVGSHRGRHILSLGLSWAASTTYDQLSIRLYLETAEGTKISSTISLPALDMGDPNKKWKEIAFASSGTRLADITVPSHYISPAASQDNIYQVIEVTNDASAPAEWLDCCTLLPTDRCVELSGIAHNFLLLDGDEEMALSSQDGSFDTAAVYDPARIVDAPRFEADPNGINMVVLAGRNVSGDERLSPKLDLTLSYEPQYWMIPGASP